MTFLPSALMSSRTSPCALKATTPARAIPNTEPRIAIDGSTRQKPPMALEEIQRDADEWIRKHTPGYFTPLMMLARLTEELGELSRAVSHHHGEKKPKPCEDKGTFEDEIGDLLFVLV